MKRRLHLMLNSQRKASLKPMRKLYLEMKA
jgi:hypothetical protein